MLGVDRRQRGYTVDEAATVLQFHPDAIRYWVRVGALSSQPSADGTGLMISPRDLVAFLRENGEMPPSGLPAQG